MDKEELKAKLLKKAAVERKYKAEIGRSLLRGYKAKREEAASKIKSAIKRKTEQSFYNNFIDNNDIKMACFDIDGTICKTNKTNYIDAEPILTRINKINSQIL